MKKAKNNGITLIALVVTIIVLLILAGVSLNLISGSNGILSQATKAANQTKIAQIKEALELANAEILMDQYAQGEFSEDLYGYIKAKCEESSDKTVRLSNGIYWLDASNQLHYRNEALKMEIELQRDENGNLVMKNIKDDAPDVANVAYQVEHYQMDLTGNYPTSATEIEHKMGVSDSSVTVADLKKTYDGFTYQYGQVNGANATTITISADGTCVIKLYYERNQYTITYNANGGSECPATTAYYGANITMPTPTVPNDKFTGFNGWYTAVSGGTKRNYTTMPAGNETVYAQYVGVTGVGTSIMKGAWYGDSVNYGTVNECSNWKVFSKDGDNIYLIAGDVVAGSTLTLTGTMTINGNYVYTTDSSNTTLVNWMTTTSNWSKFVNTIYADQATGGPTLAQLATSANGKLGTSYTADSIENQRLNDALYKSSDYWWLASTNKSYSDRGWHVAFYSDVYTYYLVSNDNLCGIRPLVRLKPDVKMTWNGSAWDLSI